MITIGNGQIKGSRSQQEDYFAVPEMPGGALAIVADGMGGYHGGNVASAAAVKAFVKTFKENYNSEDIPTILEKSLHQANAAIKALKIQNASYQQMGTTMVAVFFSDSLVYWISAGDSPFYRLREGKMERLNADHSFGAEIDRQAEMGMISKEEARHHPRRHIITSGLDGQDINLIDKPLVGLDLKTGDRFLIASDGVQTIDKAGIAAMLEAHASPQELVQTLLQAVEKEALPDQDNCTVVSVHIGKSAEKSRRSYIPALLIGLISIIGVAAWYFSRPPASSSILEETVQPKPAIVIADSTLDSLRMLQKPDSALLKKDSLLLEDQLIHRDSSDTNNNLPQEDQFIQRDSSDTSSR